MKLKKDATLEIEEVGLRYKVKRREYQILVLSYIILRIINVL